MIEDDVAAILTKTREYYDFIKSRLEKASIKLKQEDQEVLGAINSYLTMFSEDISKWDKGKSEVHKNILATCITYLQRLDGITKEYKLFPNGDKGSYIG